MADPPPPGFQAFELDLMRAVMDQLVPRLDIMPAAPLTAANAAQLPNAQGIYLLLHGDTVKYVGKTDSDAGLNLRIRRHQRKLRDRRNISPEDVSFKAVQVLVLTALDIETELRRHYSPEWNGSGFGANDPGRERETTTKPPEGFDAQFPINIDVPLVVASAGEHEVAYVLSELKANLPYLLRFETAAKGKKGAHADMRSRMTLPASPLSVRQILQRALAALPTGWQATEFVSHVILYKEDRTYAHGTKITPLVGA